LVLPVLQRTARRLICFEGAIRLGKSWGSLILVWCLALLHPGIKILIARWKQEDVDGTLTEVWESVAGLFPKALHPRWDAQKHAYIFANGSLVYKKSLKSAENETRDSKWRGMTLSVIVIDQFEECPKFVLEDIRGRLSQNKHAVTNKPYRYPLHLILLLNSIDEEHWLAEHFPTDNSIPGRLYLTGSVWDNRVNLGEDVIAGLEEDYPPGDPRRRTLLEGKRGVVVDGTPCYEGYFDPAAHVSTTVAFNQYLPLLEGWDFSHSHPAVLWAQWDAYAARLNILGGVQGYSMFLEHFAPKALEIRYRWFPQCGIPTEALESLEHVTHGVAVPRPVDTWSWCDPAGATNTSGSRVTAVTTLQNFGVYPRSLGNANAAPERFAAIQALGGLMLRTARDGGRAVRINPRCVELRRQRGKFIEAPSQLAVDAMSLGYVWDDKAAPDNNPNVKRPKKNHRGDKFSHLMNGLEYIVLGEGLVRKVTEVESRRARDRFKAAGEGMARQLRQAQGIETMAEHLERIAKESRKYRDHDASDQRYGKGRYRLSGPGARGGYGIRSR
jgi:hypothetical protein